MHGCLLMMLYELNGIMFFVKSFKTPTLSFNISNYLKFSTCNTHSFNVKLIHTTDTRSSNNTSVQTFLL